MSEGKIFRIRNTIFQIPAIEEVGLIFLDVSENNFYKDYLMVIIDREARRTEIVLGLDKEEAERVFNEICEEVFGEEVIQKEIGVKIGVVNSKGEEVDGCKSEKKRRWFK